MSKEDIGWPAKAATQEFEHQLRKGRKQYARPLPYHLGERAKDSLFLYIEETPHNQGEGDE